MASPAVTSHSQEHLPDPPVLSVRSGCRIRLPARYNDYLPAAPHGLHHVTPPPDSPGPSLQPSPPSDASDDPFKSSLVKYQTKPDHMGLFRIYPTQPTFIPDVDHSVLTYVEAPTLDTTSTSEHKSDRHSEPSHPTSEAGLPMDITPENVFSAFSSLTAALLMCWQYSGSNLKSAAKLNHLWTNVIQDPKFDPKTTSIFNHDRERNFIEKYIHNESNPFKADCYAESTRRGRDVVKGRLLLREVLTKRRNVLRSA